MKRFAALLLPGAAGIAALAFAMPTQRPVASPAEIIAAAPAGDWRPIPADRLLVMDLAPDAAGGGRQVGSERAPPPVSAPWVANIRALAGAGYWDGLAIDRVQDNYVVQWGAPNDGRTPPAGLGKVAQDDYRVAAKDVDWRAKGADPYARRTGFYRGWAVAGDNAAMWPVHCYGAVGVGRELPPDAGNGAELYAVIGHAPRHLDGNIALVGRVVDGMEHLSSLPRGHGELGFYTKEEVKTPIRRIAVASALPVAERPKLESLDPGSGSFKALIGARENRRDPFFLRPAGGADICNLPVPVRRAP